MSPRWGTRFRQGQEGPCPGNGRRLRAWRGPCSPRREGRALPEAIGTGNVAFVALGHGKSTPKRRLLHGCSDMRVASGAPLLPVLFMIGEPIPKGRVTGKAAPSLLLSPHSPYVWGPETGAQPVPPHRKAATTAWAPRRALRTVSISSSHTPEKGAAVLFFCTQRAPKTRTRFKTRKKLYSIVIIYTDSKR